MVGVVKINAITTIPIPELPLFRVSFIFGSARLRQQGGFIFIFIFNFRLVRLKLYVLFNPCLQVVYLFLAVTSS